MTRYKIHCRSLIGTANVILTFLKTLTSNALSDGKRYGPTAIRSLLFLRIKFPSFSVVTSRRRHISVPRKKTNYSQVYYIILYHRYNEDILLKLIIPGDYFKTLIGKASSVAWSELCAASLRPFMTFRLRKSRFNSLSMQASKSST